MDPGSSSTLRSTASPRKTCVPGVHAQASDGRSASATSASASALQTEPLPLAQDRAPDAADDFPLDRVAKRLPGAVHALPDRASLARPPFAAASRSAIDHLVPTLADALEEAAAVAAGEMMEQQRDARTDGRPDQRRGKQVVFSLTRSLRRSASGPAGAPCRRLWSCRRSHRCLPRVAMPRSTLLQPGEPVRLAPALNPPPAPRGTT